MEDGKKFKSFEDSYQSQGEKEQNESRGKVDSLKRGRTIVERGSRMVNSYKDWMNGGRKSVENS